MSILDKIKRGNGDLPPRILVSGPEGVGKSTLGSNAPSPLFISAEDGLTGLDHVQRFSPTDLSDLHAMLDGLSADPSGFKTIVVDTTDWLERLVCASICKRDNKSDIEDYGYGKGYVIMEGELVKLLQKFDALRHKHRLGIVLLAHVHIRAFNDPRGEAWDRYEMKGHKKFTGILREWPDACLFAVFEVFKTKDKAGHEKAIGGERILHTEWSPAWDAKNRLNLPATLPLDWNELQAAIAANSPTTLRAAIRAAHALAALPEADQPRWEAWLTKLDTFTPDKLKAALEKLQKFPKKNAKETTTTTTANPQ